MGAACEIVTVRSEKRRVPLMCHVMLKRITAENWRTALELSVAVDQQAFVSAVTPPAAIALAKAYIRPEGKMVEPYGVYHQQNMVGFFNLHFTPDSEADYWLFHFFIDQKHQRRGLGSAAIKALITHLNDNHPSCRSIRLTVHPDNHAGKQFYTRLGFRNDNVLTFGEPTYSLRI